MNFLTTVGTDSNLESLLTKIDELMDKFWIYAIAILSVVIVVWGIYIGVRVIIANKNEEKINAKSMIKNLLIGIIVIFVIAVGAPLLIESLKSWAGVSALVLL